jgi:hypothetical protein
MQKRLVKKTRVVHHGLPYGKWMRVGNAYGSPKQETIRTISMAWNENTLIVK